jgi:hypothetical protein
LRVWGHDIYFCMLGKNMSSTLQYKGLALVSHARWLALQRQKLQSAEQTAFGFLGRLSLECPFVLIY